MRYIKPGIWIIVLSIQLICGAGLVCAADEGPVKLDDWAEGLLKGIQTAKEHYKQKDAEANIKRCKKEKRAERIRGCGDSEEKDYAQCHGRVEKTLTLECTEVSQRDALYNLDLEVDMLVAALIQLQKPDQAVSVYERWYPEGQPIRTPAAIYQLSRAYFLDGKSELRKADMNVSWIDRFRKANIKLSKALKVFEFLAPKRLAELGALKNDGFLYWIQCGLPKPFDKDKTHREPFPGYLAVEFVKRYLFLQAKINMELGDLAYRNSGDGMSVPDQSTVSGDMKSYTAAAYYQQSRNSLYLLRLMDGKNPFYLGKAEELEKRIQWLKRGLPYGGEEFFSFGWYSPSKNSPFSCRTEFETALKRLSDYNSKKVKKKVAVAKWIQQIQHKQAGRKQLREQFKAQMSFQLISRLADLNLKNNQNELRALKDRADWIDSSIEQLIGTNVVTLQSADLEYTVNQDMSVYKKEAIGLTTELRNYGLTSFLKNKLSEEQDKLKPASNIPAFGGLSLLERLNSIKNERTGLIFEAKSNLQMKSIAVQRAAAELAYYRGPRELEELKAKVKALESQDEDLKADLNEIYAKYDRMVAENETDKVIEMLELSRKTALRKLSTTGKFIKRVRDYIKAFNDHIKKAKKLAKEGKKAARELKAAHKNLTKLMTTAKSIPITHTGTNSGTSIDMGAALERIGKAAMEEAKSQWEALDKEKADEQSKGTLIKTADSLDEKLGMLEEKIKKQQERLEEINIKKKYADLIKRPSDNIFNRLHNEINRLKKVGDDAQLKKAFSGVNELPLADLNKNDMDRWKNQLTQYITPIKTRKDKVLMRIGNQLDKIRNEINGSDAGQLWKWLAKEKAAWQARKTEIALALYAARLEQSAVSEMLAGHDEQDLKWKLQQSEEEEKWARSTLERREEEQKTIYEQLLVVLEQYQRAGNFKTGLGSTVETFKSLFETFAKKQDKTYSQMGDQVQDIDAALKNEIDRVEEELMRIQRPEGRMLTADMLQQLSPALLLSDAVPEKEQTLLDEANAALMKYGRWAYLLSGGNRSVLTYARPCTSIDELVYIQKRLSNIVNRSPFEDGRIGWFAITLDSTDIKSILEKSNSGGIPVKLVAGQFKEGGTYKYIPAENTPGKMLNLYEYRRDGKGDGSVASFSLPHLQDSGGILLLGYIPVPDWERNHGEFALSFVPRGYSIYRFDNRGIRFPIYYSQTIYDTSTGDYQNVAWAGKELADYFDRDNNGQTVLNFKRRPPSDSALYRDVAGRGLEGGYFLDLKCKVLSSSKKCSAEFKKNNGWAALNSVTVYFFYLDFSGAGQDTLTKLECRKLTDFLKKSSPTIPKITETALARDRGQTKGDKISEIFEKAWDGNEESKDAFLKFLKKEDGDGLNVNACVASQKTGSIFKPVDLAQQLKAVWHLQDLMWKSIEKNTVTPLKQAVVCLKNFAEYKDGLEKFKKTVMDHNRCVSAFNEYAKDLSNMAITLDNRELDSRQLHVALESFSNQEMRRDFMEYWAPAELDKLLKDPEIGDKLKSHYLDFTLDKMQKAMNNRLSNQAGEN